MGDSELIREGFNRIAEGDLDGAYAFFIEGVGRVDVASGASYGMGVVEFAGGDFHLAERSFQDRLVWEDSDDADALYYLGLISEQEGDLEHAIQLLASAIEITPLHADAVRELSRIRQMRSTTRDLADPDDERAPHQ